MSENKNSVRTLSRYRNNIRVAYPEEVKLGMGVYNVDQNSVVDLQYIYVDLQYSIRRTEEAQLWPVIMISSARMT